MVHWFKRISRPMPRSTFITPAICGFFPLMFAIGHRHDQIDILYICSLALTAIWAPIWVIATCGRLNDLDKPRWLMFLYLIPWTGFIWTIFHMDPHPFLLAFGVLVLTELPLALIPGRAPDFSDMDSDRP